MILSLKLILDILSFCFHHIEYNYNHRFQIKKKKNKKNEKHSEIFSHSPLYF